MNMKFQLPQIPSEESQLTGRVIFSIDKNHLNTATCIYNNKITFMCALEDGAPGVISPYHDVYDQVELILNKGGINLVDIFVASSEGMHDIKIVPDTTENRIQTWNKVKQILLDAGAEEVS